MPARIVWDWFGSELNTNNISNISDSATSDFFEIRSFFYWKIVADCMFECTNVQFFAPPAGEKYTPNYTSWRYTAESEISGRRGEGLCRT